ncbi:N-ethylammeline chlorohydrolase [Novimethylophilus kurashikiensis]|uniref:N-ethylammeline chlorohydrolase n=1 Tax=Novimethylophilus kurashikiensis TaxID=1825523 RepID=A0A2R5F7P8_9PROT|nr:hypothetical protein [Novimethylophilus kurashikiensis]GBG14217.1 N-ethylammeline chlorohydrolase [Novimethylophilus kurashikiensis]
MTIKFANSPADVESREMEFRRKYFATAEDNLRKVGAKFIHLYPDQNLHHNFSGSADIVIIDQLLEAINPKLTNRNVVGKLGSSISAKSATEMKKFAKKLKDIRKNLLKMVEESI